MRWLIFIFGFVCCVPAGAQYNSDYKTVAKQKIRTATSTWSVPDKIYSRIYTYEKNGRLIKEVYADSEYEAKTYMERRYSVSGQMISSYSLGFRPARSSYVPVNGMYKLTYDTSSLEITKFDSVTGEEVYYLDLDYENGKPSEGTLFEIGDSVSRSYLFEQGGFVLTYLSVKFPVDTLKRAYAETEYYIGRRNISDRSSPVDTSVYSRVIVMDKHKGITAYYALLPDKLNDGYVRNADGTLYTQVHDSTCYLKLYYTYKNRYWRDGGLRSYTKYDHLKNTSEKYEFSRRYREPGIDSLKEIKKDGKAVFEYYE